MRRTSELGWLIYDPPVRLLVGIGVFVALVATIPRTLGAMLERTDLIALAALGLFLLAGIVLARVRHPLAGIVLPAALGLLVIAIIGLVVAVPVGRATDASCLAAGGCFNEGRVAHGPILEGWILNGLANGAALVGGWLAWRLGRVPFGHRFRREETPLGDPVLAQRDRRRARDHAYIRDVEEASQHQGVQGAVLRRPED